MKKSYYLLTSLLITAILFSCQSIFDQESKVSNNPQDYIGQLHNEGMDYILNEIIKLPKTKSGTKFFDIQYIKKATISFMKKKELLNKQITKSTYNDTFLDSLNFSDAPISNLQKDYLIRLIDILTVPKEADIKTVTNNIIELENEILQNNNLGENECFPILCGCSVARYSAIYWNKNLEKWRVNILGINKSQQKTITTKSGDPEEGFWDGVWDIAKEDAIGAALGALGGAGIGGIGAGPGAIGGGCIASGTEAAHKIF